MSASSGQEKEQGLRQLAVVRGGIPQGRPERYVARRTIAITAAELELDRDMEILFGAVLGADKKPPTRGFRRAAWGEARPHRIIARWFIRARRKGTPREQLHAILQRLDRFVDAIYASTSDRAA